MCRDVIVEKARNRHRENGIMDCERRGTRGCCSCRQAWCCRAKTRGSRRSRRTGSRRASNGTNQSWVLWGLSRLLMNKAHTNPGTTPKHCLTCHASQVRWQTCRRRRGFGCLHSRCTTQCCQEVCRHLFHLYIQENCETPLLFRRDMHIPIRLPLASASL